MWITSHLELKVSDRLHAGATWKYHANQEKSQNLHWSSWCIHVYLLQSKCQGLVSEYYAGRVRSTENESPSLEGTIKKSLVASLLFNAHIFLRESNKCYRHYVAGSFRFSLRIIIKNGGYTKCMGTHDLRVEAANVIAAPVSLRAGYKQSNTRITHWKPNLI